MRRYNVGTDPLEKKKIELEIKKLQTPFYKDLEFYKATIPTIAIIASLYFTFGQGLLDNEKSILELQKEQLRLDIARFEKQKESIIDSIQVKKGVEDSLSSTIRAYHLRLAYLANELNELGVKYKKIGIEKDRTGSEMKRDKQFYDNELIKEYRLKKRQLEEYNTLKENESKLLTKIKTHQAEINYYKKKYKLTQNEKIELDILKRDIEMKDFDARTKESLKSLDMLDKELEIELKKNDNMSTEEMQKWFDLYFLRKEAEKN